MHGCSGLAPAVGISFRTVRDVPEIRDVISSLGTEFEQPLATIREAVGSLSIDPANHPSVQPHLSTALAMCDDVAGLTQRYLDYLQHARSLPLPQLLPVRPDELLAEVDRQIIPEAFERGVVWNCAFEGPIRPILTDRALWCEAVLEWARLAVESAIPGDLVTISLTCQTEGEHESRMTLTSSSRELIAHLTSLCEDPLFSRHVCLEDIGVDTGSRLALSLERLLMLDTKIQFGHRSEGLIGSAQFRFPVAPRSGC